jgi:hypothetical protein
VRVTCNLSSRRRDSNCHTHSSISPELRCAAISGACKRTLGINVPGDGLDLSGVSRSLRRFINLLPLCVCAALVARNIKPFIPIRASRRTRLIQNTHTRLPLCMERAFIVFEQTLSMARFESERTREDNGCGRVLIFSMAVQFETL